jgi:hypothetical protein
MDHISAVQAKMAELDASINKKIRDFILDDEVDQDLVVDHGITVSCHDFDITHVISSWGLWGRKCVETCLL